MTHSPAARFLIRNQIRTPDDTILRSYSVHDYKEHIDRISGEMYMVDGGNDYIRRTINKMPAIAMDVYSDAPFEEIRQALAWGSYGRYGDQPKHYILLYDMTDGHILMCLKTQTKMHPFYKECFEKELEFRYGKNKINQPEG